MSRYVFHPIADAPRDGTSLVLGDDTGWQAVGHFHEGIWWLGHALGDGFAEQLEFEPTKYAMPLRHRKALSAQSASPAGGSDRAQDEQSNGKVE